MVKKLFIALVTLFLFSGLFSTVYAQSNSVPSQIQEKGVILSEKSKDLDEKGKPQSISYSVKLDNGKVIIASYQLQTLQTLNIHQGSEVVVLQAMTPNGSQYQIIDLYRLPSVFYFLIVFAIVAIAIVGKKGIGSIFGVCISLLI